MKARLDHVNLTVRNLDDSIQWYEQVFGFSMVEIGQKVDLEKGEHRWAILAQNDSMIAMTEYPDKLSADDAPHTHWRLFHFGLRIDDIIAWRETIKAHRLFLHYGGEIEYPHSRSWYVNDPSGHQIEVSYTMGQPLQFPPVPS